MYKSPLSKFTTFSLSLSVEILILRFDYSETWPLSCWKVILFVFIEEVPVKFGASYKSFKCHCCATCSFKLTIIVV